MLVLCTHLNCDFDGNRTGIAEKHAVKSMWSDRGESFGQFYCGGVGESAEHYMGKFFRLAADGLDNRGVAMAVRDAPPAGNGVDKAASVIENDIYAFRSCVYLSFVK